MRGWLWIAALVVVVSACGADDSHGDTAGASVEGVVESADGSATLSLPEGSLPEGVSPGDIHIEARFSDSDDPAMPIVAVRLLPNGLVLGEPASLTVA